MCGDAQRLGGLVMKLISLVTGNDDAFGCDYVLVNLTSNLALLAWRRVAMLKEQKHMDDSLVESYFWNAHGEYIGPRLEQEKEADTLAERFERLPAVAANGILLPNGAESPPHPAAPRISSFTALVPCGGESKTG
jgi:hypothetical protein